MNHKTSIKASMKTQGYLGRSRRPQCGNCQHLSTTVTEGRCGPGGFPVSLSGWCRQWQPKNSPAMTERAT